MSGRFLQVLATSVLLLGVLSAGRAEDAEPTPSWEDYDLVIRKNIFVRDRESRPVRAVEPSEETPPPPPAPEEGLVLRGVTQRSGVSIAFVERLQTGETTVLHVGDSIAAGRLAAIVLDHVDYESGERTARVEVGQNFLGESAAPHGPWDVPLVSVDFTDASSGNPSAGPEEAAILERLRQRREQEAGR